MRSRYKLPYLECLLQFCKSRKWKLHSVRVWYAIDPANPDTLALIFPRPSDRHIIRKKQADFFKTIRTAATRGKLFLMRYDPQNELKRYDPNSEPYYNSKTK